MNLVSIIQNDELFIFQTEKSSADQVATIRIPEGVESVEDLVFLTAQVTDALQSVIPTPKVSAEPQGRPIPDDVNDAELTPPVERTHTARGNKTMKARKQAKAEKAATGMQAATPAEALFHNTHNPPHYVDPPRRGGAAVMPRMEIIRAAILAGAVTDYISCRNLAPEIARRLGISETWRFGGSIKNGKSGRSLPAKIAEMAKRMDDQHSYFVSKLVHFDEDTPNGAMIRAVKLTPAGLAWYKENGGEIPQVGRVETVTPVTEEAPAPTPPPTQVWGQNGAPEETPEYQAAFAAALGC